MASSLKLDWLDDDPDDPIVWQRSKFDEASGRFVAIVMTRSVEQALVKEFGREWLDRHLSCHERQIDGSFVH